MKINLSFLILFVLAAGDITNTFAQSSTQIITTIAGYGAAGYGGDGGAATSALLDSPGCLAMDLAGNLFISDQRNSCVRKVDAAGKITTIAGTGVSGITPDGLPATSSKFNLNWGIATDLAGNVYVTDQANYRICKVSTSGLLTTVAGTGSQGFSGDGGPATNANFQSPMGIAVDGAGNIYIGDPNNFRVRKVSTSGQVTTVAGNGKYGFSADNIPATDARLSYIFGLATDASGNLFICDAAANRIRKVDASGIITTIAGTGAAGYSGDGGHATDATLNYPLGVFVHSSGEVYISDYLNNRVRKIDPSGVISTIAGTGVKGFNGDDIPATAGELFHPISTIRDNSDNIYITDLDNVRIRKVRNAKTLSFTGGKYQNMTACENFGATSLGSVLTIIDYEKGFTDTWSLIAGPSHGYAVATYSSAATGARNIPTGLAYTPVAGYLGNDTFTARVTNGVLSDTTTIYVTVATLPSAGTVAGSSRVCIGSTITVSSSVAGGVWTCSNSRAKVNGSSVTGLAAGLDTLRYTVTNVCGSDSRTKMIKVDSLPDPGTITGPSSFCNGSTILLQASKPGGVWSCTDSWVVVDSGSVTSHAPGSVVIKYTVSDSYCSATTIHPLLIDAFPDAGTITGEPHVCIGSSIALMHSVAGGEWKTSNGLAEITPDGKLTGLAQGIDTVGYSIRNTCGEDIALKQVTIDPLPASPAIVIRQDTCFVPAGYAYYQWLLNGAQVAGAIYDTLFLTAAGTYAAIVTDSQGCSVSSQPVTYAGCSPDDVFIFPNPAASVVYVSWCKKVVVKLLSMDGKELRVAANVNRLELDGFPDGIYLVTVYDSEGKRIRTKRITKLTR